MKEFFALYPALAWSLVSVMLALIVVMTLWDKLKWWWHNTWYSFPLIGRLASLSRDPNADAANPGWFKAERALCRDYKQFIRIQNEYDFNQKVAYLTKAGDLGRRDTPGLIWLLTVAMVFVEAMGFSYVLAGYTIPGASENTQQLGAIGIAFLVSVILVAFTHFAGHELYKSLQIRSARREWIEQGRQGDLSTGEIALAKDQSEDDGRPAYVQLTNRVGKRESYLVTMLTCFFVVLIAVAATYVRGQVLEKQLQQQVTGQLGEARSAAPADAMDMAAHSPAALPEADLQADRRADIKAAADEASIDRHGGWGTFIALAFIFVFLQILGILFGFRWGFAGKNSAQAFKAIGAGRYATYADVREHYNMIADKAQSKLDNLQQRLNFSNGVSGTRGTHASKKFRDFMHEMRLEEEADYDSQRAMTRRSRAPADAAPPAAPPTAAASSALTCEQALRRLDEIPDDKQAKKKLIDSLSATVADEVVAALKQRKEAARQRDAELEDLL